jgi:hypothetical protein
MRTKWLRSAILLALAVPALFGSQVPASSAQQNTRSEPGGGCYICGTLEYVLVEGAYWFGILAQDACPRYLGDRRASAETRRSYCNQLRFRTGQVCQQSASVCDSPNGRYCGDTMPEKGPLFASGRTSPAAKYYSDASTGSAVIGNFPNGTRLHYNETRVIDGQRWYHITPPGRPAGWMPGSDVSCTRPGEPNPSLGRPPVLNPDGTTPRPTAAQVAGARG